MRGVNTEAIGDIVQQGLRMAPTVRGIHFQPVSYFGRFPGEGSDERRFTLPELMRALEDQTTGLIKLTDFSPPGCEHAHCSFHATYINSADGKLRPLASGNKDTCCGVDFGTGGVRKTVETVSRRWAFPSKTTLGDSLPMAGDTCCGQTGIMRTEEDFELDLLLQNAAGRSFTISAMAFQDADNLDLERLRGCCISVVAHDGRLIPFCAYNLTGRNGRSLYRNNMQNTL